ncbi:hypothetical protein PILCRDRAFT_89100 [Piloderma croceum F 1598]|uniref:Protein kinase domain-containing protein n=1 Tax=Piloderma croceum (strain F 1598) TaxID=765440 RepID=A0A0C3BWE5_PILCF|nr:hypothetical protein PILCRDRAFT_89100 [Piloderma croceum F 1598]
MSRFGAALMKIFPGDSANKIGKAMWTRKPNKGRSPAHEIKKHQQRTSELFDRTYWGSGQSSDNQEVLAHRIYLYDFLSQGVDSKSEIYNNKHVSVNADGTTLVDLEFVEEPLGVTAEQGHGFLRIEFGDAIGPGKRYKVVRKLGWGMNSSIWMAFDEKEEKYVAIKALKGDSTDLAMRGIMWELPAIEVQRSHPIELLKPLVLR